MKKIIMLFISLCLLLACSNDEIENESPEDVSDESVEDVSDESVEDVSDESENNSLSPEEYVKSMNEDGKEDGNSVDYDNTEKTFTFKIPAEAKSELINDNNNSFSDDEYEEMIEDVKDSFWDTYNMIVDNYGNSYKMIVALDNEEQETLFKIENDNVVIDNLDMRVENPEDALTDLDKEQYDLLGDYIYIDYRNYVNNLEDLITDSYNGNITEEEFVDELGENYSELTYYCKTLLVQSDETSNETLSDEMSRLAADSYLSCSTLETVYLNLMLPSSDGIEASEILEESIEYFEQAKTAYDSF